MIEYKNWVQAKFEECMAVLEDPRDTNQIQKDVRERLAEQIVKAVVESRDTITKSLRKIEAEAARPQIPPPPL